MTKWVVFPRWTAVTLPDMKLTTWISDNTEAAEFIASLDIEAERASKFTFLAEMVSQLKRKQALSPAQTAAVLKIKAARIRMAEQRAAEAAEPQPTTPAPEGRQTVVGTIKSDKWVESQFGTTRKMLVKLDDHNKVWCSVPSKLFGFEATDLRGKRIKLTATFTRSDKDEHFSFGSRPSAEPA